MVTFAYDLRKNAAVSSVATAPSPATSGTSLVVASGEGARFPTAPFNATVLPVNAIATPSNMEIIRVTARTTDTLTIVRAQEGSSARTIVAGDVIYAGFTDKALADLETILTSYLQPWANKTVPSGAVVGLSDTQTLTGKTMDGTVNVFLNIPNSAVPNLGIPKTIVYTANGSLAASDVTGCTRLRVHCWGGGGGSGGNNISAGFSPGGGAGEYSMSVLDVASVTFPVTITVGAAGTAGASTPTAGGNGGNTSFGSLVIANGGTGGPTGIAAAKLGSAGGSGGTGDFRVNGTVGGPITGSTLDGGGVGGMSYLGIQGRNVNVAGTVGNAGIAPGGGAGGSMSNGATAIAGALGSAGRVVVEAM